jgi:hypothetical protein
MCNYGDSTISGFWLYPNADCRERHVGISDVRADDGLSIYPNPVSDLLHIDGLSANSLIQVFDPEGRLVITTKQDKQINVHDLSPGVYVVYIADQDGNNRRIRRFVKE